MAPATSGALGKNALHKDPSPPSVGGGEGLGEGAFEVIRVGFLEITEKQSQ